MLILTRHEGQVVCIGERIRIRVTAIGESQVKLGIEAPDELLILREELMDFAKPISDASM